MRTLLSCLAAFCLLAVPFAATAGTQDGTVITFHVAQVGVNAPCSTDPAGAALTPCSNYNMSWPLNTDAVVYLVVAKALPVPGIAGMVCGIDYDGVANSGLDILSWNLCADLEFPGGGWPNAGGGDVITWATGTNCQTNVVGADGVHAVAGYFTVTAFSDDVLQITPRNYIPSPDLQVADCNAASTDVPTTDVGAAAFGTSVTGYNPCTGTVPVEPTSWGRIKTQYD